MNEELRVVITAEVKELKKSVEEAEKRIKGLKEPAEKTKKEIDKHFKNAGKAIENGIKDGVKAAGAVLAGFTTTVAGAVGTIVKSYGEYEQLTGGVEKLFGDSSKYVKYYAEEAYKTAGISANEYMQQVTGFSASLITSLGDSTDRAAVIANTAIKDMSDNANTFGTDIEAIQNAYQGFAKENYTMLDTLKLGYTGSKEGMEALLKKAEQITGTKFELGNFADMVNAIHAVQEDMEIAGTTAKEATGTIEGSIDTLKAAWDNLIIGLGNDEADIPQLVENVISSASSVLENIIPVVKEILQNIPEAIKEINPEAGAAIEEMLNIVQPVLESLKEIAGTAFDAIINAINFIAENIGLIEGLATAIGLIVTAIGLYNVVQAVKAAMDAAEVATVWALVAAQTAHAAAAMLALAPYLLIVAAIAAVIAIIVLCVKHWDEIKEAVANAWNFIKEKTQAAVEAVKQFFQNLWDGIKNIFSKVGDFFAEKFQQGVDNIKNIFNKIKDFFKGLWDGIKNIFSNIGNFFKENFQKGVDNIKNVFGKVTGFFTDVWKKIKDTFSKVGEVVGNAITNTVKKAINAVLSTAVKIINGFISAINFAISAINLIPGVNIKKLSQLDTPQLAKGGIVNTATLALIGERGKEAVVPLENNTEWLDMLEQRLSGNRDRATPIILQVDGKTFAQTSITAINQLTKQTGNLGLILG